MPQPFCFIVLPHPRQNGFVGLAALSKEERVGCRQNPLLILDKYDEYN
jgi:hypothetical protein